MPDPRRIALWYLVVLTAALAAIRPLLASPGSSPRRHFAELLPAAAESRHRRLETTGGRALNVVLFGDSTAVGLRPLLEKHLGRAMPGREPAVDDFVYPGIGFVQHVLLGECILDGTVEVAVMILNCRYLGPPDNSFNRAVHVGALVPLDRLPALQRLPWGAVGIDPQRLWSAQVLRVPGVARAHTYLEQLGNTGQAVLRAVSSRIGMRFGTLIAQYEQVGALVETFLARTFDPTTWDVDRVPPFIEYMVRRQRENGVLPLVVIDPIPTSWGPLKDPAVFDAAVYRLRVITDRITGSGGHVLDLHALLRPDQFRDKLGHSTVQGEELVAGAIAAEVARLAAEHDVGEARVDRRERPAPRLGASDGPDLGAKGNRVPREPVDGPAGRLR